MNTEEAYAEDLKHGQVGFMSVFDPTLRDVGSKAVVCLMAVWRSWIVIVRLLPELEPGQKVKKEGERRDLKCREESRKRGL